MQASTDCSGWWPAFSLRPMELSYKLIRKLTDLEFAIQDWKLRMIDIEELRKKLLDAYKALEEEIYPEGLQKKVEEIKEK